MYTHQCIAPTRVSEQCRCEIIAEECERATVLEETARMLSDGLERDDVLREYVLLRCCIKYHREKLESAPECLGLLVQEYKAVALLQIPPEMLPTSQNIGTISSNLRSGSAYSKTPNFDQFVRYATDPLDSVLDELSCPMPSKYAKNGQVYCFTRPSYPDHLKIGYTSKSAKLRVSQQIRCNPGALLQLYTIFKSPERMERLIHLQMAKHRYKIVRCSYCNRTHHEWFKTSVSEAAQIINDWAEVTKKEPLYDATGFLTERWKQRLEKLEGELTAKVLLDILELEQDQDADLLFLRDFMSMLSLI